MIVNSTPAKQFFARFFHDLAKNPKIERYNRLCRHGYPEFEGGEMDCAYAIAKSMLETKQYLDKNFGKMKLNEWQWGKHFTLEFPNQPWSSTPLKPIFHRSVPSGGNENTVNVAETHLYEAYPKMRWFGRSAPNYKQIVSLMTPSSGFYSIDTGNNGNLLAGHYFDRNEAHL